MGSGCSSNYKNNLPCDPVYDKCMFYTGDPVDEFGICTGDTYLEIITIILDKLKASDETYPLLRDKCEYIKNIIGDKDPTLLVIIEAIIIQVCSLSVDVDALKTIVNKPTFIYDLKCLTVSGQITTEKVVQAMLNDFCVLKETVESLKTEVNTIKQSTIDINTITQQVFQSITAENKISVKYSNNKVVLSGFIMPYMPLPYIGPLSNFDSSGKGIEALGWKDWYIMNGNNGTFDYRGFSFAGATAVQGPTLNPIVDPSVAGDGDYGTFINDTKGTVKFKLSIAQLPAHKHTVPPHTHDFNARIFTRKWYNDDKDDAPQDYIIDDVGAKTGPPYTSSGWIVNSGAQDTSNTGNNASIDNRQPTKYGTWVVWIPKD